MVIHVRNQWTGAVTTNHWTYDIYMYNEVLNDTPKIKDLSKATRKQFFSNTQVHTSPSECESFDWSVFMLYENFQQSIFYKYKQIYRIEIYLDNSPQHSCSVEIILNPQMILVITKFHAKFD